MELVDVSWAPGISIFRLSTIATEDEEQGVAGVYSGTFSPYLFVLSVNEIPHSTVKMPVMPLNELSP